MTKNNDNEVDSLPDEVKPLVEEKRAALLLAVRSHPGRSQRFYTREIDCVYSYLTKMLDELDAWFEVDRSGARVEGNKVYLTELGERLAQCVYGLQIEVSQLDE